MCGIFGIISKEAVLKKTLQSCIDVISYRGPDDEGLYIDNTVGLAHKRLSIVDVSSCGHQPMISICDNYILIYNGEIYNHLELRIELIKKGYQFNGSSDTETLLYGYIAWGESVLNKLNGIFAFALYDKKRQEIFIARDQFGIKPLYFYTDNHTFSFASEIKSFLQLENFDKSIDNTALVNYINYLWCPGEQTAFLKVKKLLPGHFLKYNVRKHSFTIERYYDIPFNGKYNVNYTEKELITELEQKLFYAVERQLMSDVPLGFFVSGGLDSSLIATIAQHFGVKNNPAFTIDPGIHLKEEGFSNDLEYAQRLSKKLGFHLNVIQANIDILQDFDKMIWHLDEPQADPAPLNVFNICREANKQGIKVLLGGTGGDDLFSGYRRHQALYYHHLFDKLPIGNIGYISEKINGFTSQSPFIRRFKKIIKDIDKSDVERMAGYFSWISLQSNKNLFAPGLQQKIKTYYPGDYLTSVVKNIPNEKNKLNQLLYMEMKGFLPDHNLNYTDKMSMACSVEARVPYLDVDLVNFSTTIPPHLKMKGLTTKYLLKKVAEKHLPKEIIYRKKAGFGAPVRKWILHDMEEMIQQRLSVKKINERGIFNAKTVHQLINDNKVGKYDASYTIWSLLAIESWMEQFVDGKALTLQNKQNEYLDSGIQ